MIRKSKNNENKLDFDVMFNEVQEEIQEKDAEQDIISRVPELKELSDNINKATNTCVNATLLCESVVQQYQRAEEKLGNAVNTISGRVDIIHEHIEQVMEDAPTKLRVSVNVSDADWQNIQDTFDKEHKWMLVKMQEHIREVNTMLVQERRKVRDRYKEFDGCYLGHYAQWFFWFFFTIGIFVVAGCIAWLIAQYYRK